MASPSVCRLRPEDGFEWALPQDDGDFDALRKVSHPESGRGWRPVAMRLLKEDDDGRPLARAALPWLGSHALVMRGEAVGRIGALLSDHGSVLPLRGPDELAVCAAPILEDVLDVDRSDLVRFSSGRVMRLRRPVFHSGRLAGVGAFKVAEMPTGDLFLTEDLAHEIRESGDSSGTVFETV